MLLIEVSRTMAHEKKILDKSRGLRGAEKSLRYRHFGVLKNGSFQWCREKVLNMKGLNFSYFCDLFIQRSPLAVRNG
ncbi:hypothetical protein AGR6A_pTi0015 [Agrobacterium sp. NCPPB 925]|nr:hypothetical protein AGR6A_pTi0015 [Agrobacterium sp. NCPPB 925]